MHTGAFIAAKPVALVISIYPSMPLISKLYGIFLVCDGVVVCGRGHEISFAVAAEEAVMK